MSDRDDGAAGGFDSAGPQDGSGRVCFNCGQEGHSKADCPNPRVMKCRHCDEEGHVIRDCPTAPPREFTGECRYCKKSGHMAKDCMEKPPLTCKNCQEEGHVAAGCKNPRKIDRSSAGDIPAEEAWMKIIEGAKEKDLDMVKEGIQEYLNSTPGITYVNLEQAFRSQQINLHLIALENPSLLATHTHMDLQGNLDKKYRVHYRWSDKPYRPREAQQWPQSAAENLERLKDAGETVERGVPKCTNCNELGHISKRCPQEKVEKERLVIKCYNCDQPGHRIRDCPEPRKNKHGCRNCGQSGHMASDCTEPRKAGDDVECRKCGGNSRVKCSQCGEMGHTKVRCKAEPAPVDEPTFDTAKVNGGGFGDSLDRQNGDSFTPASAAAAAAAAPAPEPEPETDANDNWGTNENVDW